MSNKPSPSLRVRVKELRMVRVGDIEGMEENFRFHPESQQDAMQGSLNELGFIDPLDVWETPDGKLRLFDGHLRKQLVNVNLSPDTMVPCNITDLTEGEAKKALLVKDALAGMADVDASLMRELAEIVEFDDADLQKLVSELAEAEEDSEVESPPVDQSGQTIPEVYNILIKCNSEREQLELLERLKSEGIECRSLIS